MSAVIEEERQQENQQGERNHERSPDGDWYYDDLVDHVFQIGALIAAAQGMKGSDGCRCGTWEVNEPDLKLIRHVKVWREEMLDPRIKLWRKSDLQEVQRPSTVPAKDANFLTLSNTRPNDPKEWKGRVEFGLKHKPLVHMTRRLANQRPNR